MNVPADQVPNVKVIVPVPTVSASEVSQLLDELRGAWAKIDPLDASATAPTDPLRLAPV